MTKSFKEIVESKMASILHEKMAVAKVDIVNEMCKCDSCKCNDKKARRAGMVETFKPSRPDLSSAEVRAEYKKHVEKKNAEYDKKNPKPSIYGYDRKNAYHGD